MQNHLFEALSPGLRMGPDRTFAVVPGGNSMTYEEFFSGALQIAGNLICCGLVPGDRVALLADKSLPVLQLYLGTIAAGGILVPVNPASTVEEARHFLTDSTPRILVCSPERQAALEDVIRSAGIEHVLSLDAHGHGTLFEGFGKEAGLSSPVPRQPQDIAAIVYTSGTTGRPKGAMLSHGALASNYHTLTQLWRFTEEDVLLHFLPVNHVHGLFVATNVALISGCSIRFFPKFDADQILEALPQATAMMGVPTHYTRLLQQDGLSQQLTSGMRLFVSGSAPLLASTHREWEERTGHRILERYGMTEANMITSHSYDGLRKAGSVGAPLPGVEVRIRGKDENLLTRRDEVGTLEIKSPGQFSGYWNNPDKTREDLTSDGWFKTGDLARRDRDGDIILEGRAKDLVISGGVNIYPKELEEIIDQSPGVMECAVVGLPHPDFGEAVVAFVVGSGSKRPSAIDLSAELDGRLARYKHPKRVIPMDGLPRNSMGKVLKSVLRREYHDLFVEQGSTG